MVFMGGGPEAPQRGDGQKRELLLCVQPLPESAVGNTISEIKEEFPNLEVQWFQQRSFVLKEGDLNIPEGKRNPICQLFMLITTSYCTRIWALSYSCNLNYM